MEAFKQALTIMSLGMALVFVILAIVVGGMILSARIIARFGGAAGEGTEPPAGDRARKQRLAAIVAALKAHGER
jgi:Na+-transporting methylmalonyl-CoA/oxaloacetate decarboxylase gamma subunit